MKTFKLDPAFLPSVRHQVYGLFGLIFLIFVSLAVWRNRGEPYWSAAFVIVAPIFAFLLLRSARRAIQTKERYWEQYELLLDHDSLEIREPASPNLVIRRGSLRRVSEDARGLRVSLEGVSSEVRLPRELGIAALREVGDLLKSWELGGG